MLLFLLTLNEFKLSGKRYECCFEEVFAFKMFEVLVKSDVYLLDKKIDEMIKKLREKQTFCYPDNAAKATSNNIDSSRT